MARIAGTDLSEEKGMEISLTYIFGIGCSTAQEILDKTGIDYNTRVKDLTEAEGAILYDGIDYCTIEGDLRRGMAMDIKRLCEINCYRDIRHRRGLSIRGQKTKTNVRTRKSPKKLVAKKK